MFAQGAHHDGRVRTSTEPTMPPQKSDSLLTCRSSNRPVSNGTEGSADSGMGGNGNGNGGQDQGRFRAGMDRKAVGAQLNPAHTGGDSRDPSGSRSSSPSGGTSAINWFNNYNNHVQSADRAEFIDNDPPFHVNHKSVYADAGMHFRHRRRIGFDIGAEESTDSRMNTSVGDQSEGFRSVIDDLTIENKELKQRLRRLKTLRCPQLDEDKLFEIKVHGLPLTKKRELEDLLRGFVAGISQTPPVRASPSNSQHASDFSGLVISDGPASALDPRVHDSGYTSVSASGRTSATPSYRPHTNPKINQPKAQPHHKGFAPWGFAKRALPMSERAKMKPVVRRLEQLFTGRKATAAGHDPFIQQELVSRSAALAERHASGSSRHQSSREGLRQASIIPTDAQGTTGSLSNYQDAVWSPAPPYLDKAPRQTSSSPADSPDSRELKEQRPTRPLDLDPGRAQYPAENMDYLRHLGVCSPKRNPDLSLQEDEGWVYLNVLINMAQLHTINVTPEFVRKAITNLSDKLELSPDGRKIRWRGGTEGTNVTNDSGISGIDRSSSDSPEEQPTGDGEDPKRRKLEHGLYERKSHGEKGPGVENFPLSNAPGHVRKRRKPSFGSSNSAESELQSVRRGAPKNDRFNYRPLFFHGARYDEDNGYRSLENSYSAHSSQFADISSGQDSRAEGRISSNDKSKGSRSLVHRTEDGPIIFFSGADFCTDLSGDGSTFSPSSSSPAPNGLGTHPAPEEEVLGCSRPSVAQTASSSSDFSHPLTASRPIDREDGDSDKDSDKVLEENIAVLSRFNLSPELLAHHNEEVVQPIELEASGVGGVHPSDNFAINVSSTITKGNSASPQNPQSTPNSRIQRIVRAILRSSTPDPLNLYRTQTLPLNPHITHKLLSATRIDLPPSPLPPPSYFFHSSSEGDTNSDSNYSSSRIGVGGLALTSPSQSSFNHNNICDNPCSGTKDSAESSDNSSSINFILPYPKRVHDDRAKARARESMLHKHESTRDPDADEVMEGDNDEGGLHSSAATAGGVDESDASGYESGDDDRS